MTQGSYRKEAMLLKASRDRNRPLLKQPLPVLLRAIALHDKAQADSDEIRERHGLPLIPESPYFMTVRGRAKELEAKARKQAACKPKTTAERVDELAKRRAKHKREEVQIEQELRDILALREVPVRQVADTLGLTRQRLYQLTSD